MPGKRFNKIDQIRRFVTTRRVVYMAHFYANTRIQLGTVAGWITTNIAYRSYIIKFFMGIGGKTGHLQLLLKSHDRLLCLATETVPIKQPDLVKCVEKRLRILDVRPFGSMMALPIL